MHLGKFIFIFVLSLVSIIHIDVLKSCANEVPDINVIAPNESENMLQLIQDASFWNRPEMVDVRGKYPNLYATQKLGNKPTKDTVFLTFDDGPSKVTEQVLDVLKKHEVKATFFVVGQAIEKYPEITQRIISEGHAIGLHTYSHNYKNIYAFVDAYFKDLNDCLSSIRKITKSPINIVRFPGGSNSRYNHLDKEIQAELARRNFVYFDWNIDSGDAKSKNVSSHTITNNVLRNIERVETPVILMHDEASKKSGPKALDTIISTLKKRGYKFDMLSNSIAPVQFFKS